MRLRQVALKTALDAYRLVGEMGDHGAWYKATVNAIDAVNQVRNAAGRPVQNRRGIVASACMARVAELESSMSAEALFGAALADLHPGCIGVTPYMAMGSALFGHEGSARLDDAETRRHEREWEDDLVNELGNAP